MNLTKKQQLLHSMILHKIYTRHTISRTDIARETGITPATVSLITAEMLSERLIQELGEEYDPQDKVGRKKILLSAAPKHSYYIGAEISERFFSFVLTDNTGFILQQDVNVSAPGMAVTHDTFIDMLSQFIESTGYAEQISSIGIAIPGHYTEETKHQIMTNNTYWKNFNLTEIKNRFSIPVYYSNNVHCMARAESIFYTTPETNNSNFLFFHIGRGIHCTHMYHDDLYGKQNLKIGEVGHIIVRPDGEQCECGKRGCLQTYASEAWLIRKAKLLYDNVPDTSLRRLVQSKEEIELSTLLTAYELGDEMVVKLISSAIKSIGIAITNLNMIIDSERVFIHGKLFQSEQTIALLKNYINFEPKLFTLPSKQELIIKPYSPYTGAIGAAALSVYRFLLHME